VLSQDVPRPFSAAQPNKQQLSSSSDAGAALNMYRPLGKATARFDPIKIGARHDPPVRAPEDAARLPTPTLGNLPVQDSAPRAPLRALERVYEVVDAAKLGASVESSVVIHEGWLTQVKPSGQKLVYGVLKPGFFRYYRAAQKVQLFFLSLTLSNLTCGRRSLCWTLVQACQCRDVCTTLRNRVVVPDAFPVESSPVAVHEAAYE
jgi:hypothetical protein